MAPSQADSRARPSRPMAKGTMDWKIIFNIFVTAHLFGALFSPIQDCDEVFNFWEPTHYLNHGYGLQTWELSPTFAIRSWLYVSLHAIPIWMASLLPFVTNKSEEFYAMRILLGVACALCETRLFNVVSEVVSPRVALFFMAATVTSAGTFHAATAYLPSSFAMYCVALALAAFLDWRGGIRTAQGLFWLALGTIIGWPFVGVLALPFVSEELVLSLVGGDWSGMFWRLLDGLVRSLIILGFEVAVDSAFFHKVACVPLNIVLYNVFSGPGKGPDIYGTEPWHFYIRNLFINFNLWFALALISLPLLVLQRAIPKQSATRLNFYRSLIILSPFYLWLGVMTMQPHKEERFMYPVYPCLALNAAFALHILLQALGSTSPSSVFGKVPPSIKVAAAGLFILAAAALGFWRSAGLATAYSAPMSVYGSLNNQTLVSPPPPPGTSVCVAKEWYRYPSSYHLPHGTKLKFVKSGFDGLLPGEFSEAKGTGHGFFAGARLIPSGMNDENKEDIGKYTAIERCDYMVDLWYEGHGHGSTLEPAYAKDEQNWERIVCEKFLDPDRSGPVGRLGWTPDGSWVPAAGKRHWGEYCLLRRRTSVGAT